jgi:hypothetical protein
MGLLPSESRASKRFQLVNSGTAPAPFKIEFDRWGGGGRGGTACRRVGAGRSLAAFGRAGASGRPRQWWQLETEWGRRWR